jgi:hypothetical protein
MMIVDSTSGWWDDPLEVHCDFKKWGPYPKKNHGVQLKQKKRPTSWDVTPITSVMIVIYPLMETALPDIGNSVAGASFH